MVKPTPHTEEGVVSGDALKRRRDDLPSANNRAVKREREEGRRTSMEKTEM